MPNKYLVRSMLAGLCLASLTAPAGAQTGNVPETMPFDIPYGSSVTLGEAKKIIEAAETEARRHNWKYAIIVTDPSGELVLMEKMDGTQLASIQIAMAKASTAARMRRATKLLQDRADGGSASLLSLPNVIASEGGLPLIVSGKIVGAIGASGGTGAQDTVIAEAGAAAIR